MTAFPPRVSPAVVRDHGATVVLGTVPCMICGESDTVPVPRAGWVAWLSGVLVQHAFPELSTDDRELLITGIHGRCW